MHNFYCVFWHDDNVCFICHLAWQARVASFYFSQLLLLISAITFASVYLPVYVY